MFTGEQFNYIKLGINCEIKKQPIWLLSGAEPQDTGRYPAVQLVPAVEQETITIDLDIAEVDDDVPWSTKIIEASSATHHTPFLSKWNEEAL